MCVCARVNSLKRQRVLAVKYLSHSEVAYRLTDTKYGDRIKSNDTEDGVSAHVGLIPHCFSFQLTTDVPRQTLLLCFSPLSYS